MIEVKRYDNSSYVIWKRIDNNLTHREDGPAIIYNDGDKNWMQNGLDHRVGGPAREFTLGKSWWKYGKRHRLNAPARLTYKETRYQWWEFGFL